MYKKPVILVNDDLAEGIYADSGSDCWSGYLQSTQDYVDGNHIFEVRIVHSTAVEHISDAVTLKILFNYPVTGGYAENGWDFSYSGSEVTVTRTSHANAYKSGDNVTFKIWVGTGNEATTKALSGSISSFKCTKSVNVQGGGADGN